MYQRNKVKNRIQL